MLSPEGTAGVARPRVCVVDIPEVGPAYPRLDECDLDIVAVVPRIDLIRVALLGRDDVVVIGATAEQLKDQAFDHAVVRVAQAARTVAVVPGAPPQAASAAARLGFHGFVAREVEPSALSRTVAAVQAGEVAFPRSTLGALVSMFDRLQSARGAREQQLTPRQRQIVELIARGATDREIAVALRISHSTAHKHVQNALRRAQVRTRSQLVAVMRPTVG